MRDDPQSRLRWVSFGAPKRRADRLCRRGGRGTCSDYAGKARSLVEGLCRLVGFLETASLVVRDTAAAEGVRRRGVARAINVAKKFSSLRAFPSLSNEGSDHASKEYQRKSRG